MEIGAQKESLFKMNGLPARTIKSLCHFGAERNEDNLHARGMYFMITEDITRVSFDFSMSAEVMR